MLTVYCDFALNDHAALVDIPQLRQKMPLVQKCAPS